MRRLPPAVILSLVLLLAGAVLLLASKPPAYTLRSDQQPVGPVAITAADQCVPIRVLADETTAVRLQRAPGSAVPGRVTLQAGPFSVVSGAPATDGSNVVYPLPAPIRGDRLGARICFGADPAGGTISLLGQSAPTVALLGAHRGSWLSALPLLSRRVAFGRGTALGIAAFPLALLAVALAVGLLIRLGGRVLGGEALLDRRAIIVLGLVGALWGGAYAVTTPPFQSPDEVAHLRYAELLQDQHALPRTTEAGNGLPPRIGQALGDTLALEIPFVPQRRPPWTAAEDHAMDARIHAQPGSGSQDTFDNASSQPPAYYAVVAAAQTIVGGSILDDLLTARLVSALLFGLAIAGIAVFVREAVPRAGGLGVVGVGLVACLPLTGFIAGSVNPDALMVAAASWAFVVTAMVLRRGLTWRRALALGGLVGIGVLSKITFVALLPMFVAAAVVVLIRSVRGKTVRRDLPLLVGSAAAAGVVAGPYVLWAMLSGRGLVVASAGGAPGPAFGIRQWLTYTFGLFFGEVGPIGRRLARSGPIDIFGDGLVGRLGWLDYGFPRGVMLRILTVWGVLTSLAVVGLARSARARRAVPVDAVVYAIGVSGLMLVIARAGLSWNLAGLPEFEQARYLFPVAAVGAGGVALGLRQLPRAGLRTWVGSAVLVAAIAHGVAGYLLTVGRYFA